jgi:hypothetical protein
MDFHTVVLRKSAGYWVALCLENGLVGQGNTQENAIAHLKDAIESDEAVSRFTKKACWFGLIENASLAKCYINC